MTNSLQIYEFVYMYNCIMPDFYWTEKIKEQYILIYIMFRFTETHLLCMAIL